MTRSISFKLGGSTKEHVSRNGAKKSLPGPRKIDADNWLQENKTRPSHQKEVPPGNIRYFHDGVLEFDFIFLLDHQTMLVPKLHYGQNLRMDTERNKP